MEKFTLLFETAERATEVIQDIYNRFGYQSVVDDINCGLILVCPSYVAKALAVEYDAQMLQEIK